MGPGGSVLERETVYNEEEDVRIHTHAAMALMKI